MLICPVRDCRSRLERKGQCYVCERGHSFDIARSGYVNLLQPQERHSKNPGDSAKAVAARRRLHELGVTVPLLSAIRETAGAERTDVVADAGCGDGFYLGSIAKDAGCEAYGIDISTPAIDSAARRYPECMWIVANADRFLPFSDGSVSLVLSITGRMNVPEFRRVLRPGGRLLIALPAANDLIELRGMGRDDRMERTLETFSVGFKLAERGQAETRADLDAATVEDVLLSIYRPLQAEPPRATRVTFALDLLLFDAD